jgi:hypothetical protein
VLQGSAYLFLGLPYIAEPINVGIRNRWKTELYLFREELMEPFFGRENL